MELELRFFATFREAAGGKTVVREFETATDVGDVLRALEGEYDGMAGRLIVDGDLAPQINVLKNGREVLHLEGLATPLEDGDRLSVFPPVAGGTLDAGNDTESNDDIDAGNDAESNDHSDADATDEPADTGERVPAEAGWVRRSVAYRGISRRLAAHYLANLGGRFVDAETPAAATRVDGDRWRASLEAVEVRAAGSITLTEVRVSFTGDASVLEALLPQFERKAMRAGG